MILLLKEYLEKVEVGKCIRWENGLKNEVGSNKRE